MTIGFVATAVFLDRTPPPTPASASRCSTRCARCATARSAASGLTAVFYNFGFFTLLAYTPLALGLGAHELGYVFFGWGLMLAVFAVFVAPLLAAAIGDVRALGCALAGFTVLLGLMGVLHALADGAHHRRHPRRHVPRRHQHAHDQLSWSPPRSSGRSPRPPTASCGSAAARSRRSWRASSPSTSRSPSPFYLGAGMTAVAVVVLWLYRDALVSTRTRAGRGRATPRRTPMPAAAGAGRAGRRADGRRRRRPDRPPRSARWRCRWRALAGAEVHVLHVVERDIVVGEDAVDLESAAEARALLDACVAELRESGVPVTGELMRTVGTPRRRRRCEILRRAADARRRR